ncbi:hypothetical protein SAMN04487895_115115 [Paenibacillus sophorae]|uniref:Uncharacterized protein n=1 Tax=Paenibacillus sophorae TaxID=1333845 RepID=A0A1H8TZB9_9BACL|nr:hypothetical protein [Paenibacillus sophorae]QWU13115.1 hypothetical protein KP014_13815 [Paenibacillus sophorae]SEO96247.1 hypothetical protein SAMN04487895_115115 [Paenibacillus sophorae]
MNIAGEQEGDDMAEHEENEKVFRNLLDAGCSRDFADNFLHLADQQKKLRLLSCHRCSLLDKIHEYQKQLDCLDYLIYSMKDKEK